MLDNVERWHSEPRPLPVGSHVSLLVTTRFRFLAGPSFEHYTLDVLDLAAAQAFLAALSGRDLAQESGASELLAYLSGHTLALELAGTYLREFPTTSCCVARAVIHRCEFLHLNARSFVFGRDSRISSTRF